MKASYPKRCGCKDPLTGKQLGGSCPRLKERRHGTVGLDTRIDTTQRRGQRLKRFGFPTRSAAEDAFDQIRQLVALAGADDGLRRRIGDLIVERSKRRRPLPKVDEVQRKLGAGLAPDAPSMLMGDLIASVRAGQRARKVSTLRGYDQLDAHYLQLIEEIPVERVRVEHVAGIFDTIESWNNEVLAARGGARPGPAR